MLSIRISFFQCWICLLTYLMVICPIEAVPLNTSGIIRKANVENGGLHLVGDVFAFSATSPIDALKIDYLGKEAHVVIDDPINKLSFDVTIALGQEEQQSLRDTFVTVTPLADGREGYPLYYLVNTSLPLAPQEEVDVVGGADFMMVGCEFLGLFVGRCGLKSSDTVLDIGCGLGRMAYPLAYYLHPSASYYGFDIIPSLISWAQSITPFYPNFDFQLVDIYNKMYNPQGILSAETFHFPYKNAQFDFVFLTSVFTHLTYDDYNHYLNEIYRVLKPGGKCMATMFLLDNVSIRLIANGKSSLAIVHPLKNCMTAFPHLPEAVVGYNKEDVKNLLDEKGFVIQAFYPGSWCGRERDWVSYQDIVLFSKPLSAFE